VESSSFAASAGAGIIAVRVGAAALMFVTIATPVGWVGLIVTAAMASMASMMANSFLQKNGGGWYDQIMEWVNSW